MIDWQNHDGVRHSMICDYMRNQFYEDIIKDNVNGKTVLDIGFGTGILSILALKHGAKNIIAYEDNKDRFELGLEVIESCGLQEKIKLFNERYNWTMQDAIAPDVVLTETVNGDLWWEGMWNNLPRTAGSLFLPSEYFCEIYTKQIPKSFAENIGVGKTEHEFFRPGVDIDSTFTSFINDKISKWNGNEFSTVPPQQILNGINQFDNRIECVWGWQPWLRLVAQEKYLHTKSLVDANTMTLNGKPIDYSADTIECTITLDPETYTLVVPRTGLQHIDNKMYLDTGHWGPTDDAIISTGLSTVKMIQSTRTGKMKYVALC